MGRGLWTTRGTIALFAVLLVVFTPLVRLLEVPPKMVVVQVEALFPESLDESLLGAEYAPRMDIDPERGITALYYDVDVGRSRVTDVLVVDRENLTLTITAPPEHIATITVGEHTRLSDEAVFDLPDQPGWRSNIWKASWAALAGTLAVYALTRTTSRWRDHGESLAHMNQVLGSR